MDDKIDLRRRDVRLVWNGAADQEPEGGSLADEDLARALRELAVCSLTVLRVVGAADPDRIIAQPDKIGVLLERTANALVAAVEGLAGLQKIRAAAAAEATSSGPDATDANQTLIGTLEAIRRAREEQT
jgi:hypothetical protein